MCVYWWLLTFIPSHITSHHCANMQNLVYNSLSTTIWILYLHLLVWSANLRFTSFVSLSLLQTQTRTLCSWITRFMNTLSNIKETNLNAYYGGGCVVGGGLHGRCVCCVHINMLWMLSNKSQTEQYRFHTQVRTILLSDLYYRDFVVAAKCSFIHNWGISFAWVWIA